MTFKVQFGDGPLEGQCHRTKHPVATIRFRPFWEDVDLPGTYKILDDEPVLGHYLFKWVPDE